MGQSRSVVRLRGGVHGAPWRIAASVGLVMATAGLGLGRASRAAQAPDLTRPPSTTPAPSSPAETRPVADLTTRYHLVERYSSTEDRERPELIGQYRVAIRETIRSVTDNARGAPDRAEAVFQTIYTERPAQLTDGSAVMAAVRRYETFRAKPEPPAKPSAARPLEGLTIWFQQRPNDDPLVLSLASNRRLRDNEYAILSRQVFLPELASALLSPMPHRIGDRWPLSPLAARALVGERPQRAGELGATLSEVRSDSKSGQMVAVINVTGRVGLPSGEAAVNAQLLFSFAPPVPGAGAERTEGDEGTIEARGAITELRLAVVRTAGLPGANGRPRRTQTNEMNLGRQLATPTPPLAIPEPSPTPTEANSWLTYIDPRGRFHFQHPQDLRPVPPQSEEDVVELLDPQPLGPDVVSIEILPKSGDPRVDAQNRDPEFHRKNLKEQWLKDRVDVIPGDSDWLPEADWAPSKMKVYRIEAAIKPGERVAKGRVSRIFADYYLVLPSRNETLFVESKTVGEQPTAFRAQVEAMMKTFRFDAPEDIR
ncbi:MAG TPA: hypothetical protein VKP69_09575 [Isosphaeraceae bacterium]|nr:hypothetical protein [Isosphaeraceae bacterium]